MAEKNRINMGIKTDIQAGQYHFSLSASRQWNQKTTEYEKVFVVANENLAGLDNVLSLLLQMSGMKSAGITLPFPFVIEKAVLKAGEGGQREIYFCVSDRTDGKHLAAADLTMFNESFQCLLPLETCIPLHQIPVVGILFNEEDHVGGLKLAIQQEHGKIVDYGCATHIRAGAWNREIGCGMLALEEQKGSAALGDADLKEVTAQPPPVTVSGKDSPNTPANDSLSQSSGQEVKWIN